MTEKRIATFHARAEKINADAKITALFDLSDRIAALALRRGCFDFQTARMHGPFLPWGEFTGRLKVAVDRASPGDAVPIPAVPSIPEDADNDLRFALAHFAKLAGVTVPASWGAEDARPGRDH